MPAVLREGCSGGTFVPGPGRTNKLMGNQVAARTLK